MIKRSTLILIIIFVILAIAAIYLQKTGNSPAAGGTGTPAAIPTTDYVFSAQEGVVTSILIVSQDGKTLGLDRVNGVWKITKPFEADAVASSAEEAATQITALPILDTLQLDNSAVGLDKPAYTITVKFSDGVTSTVQVGDQTPTGNGYYVRKEGGPVLVVSTSGISALTGILDAPPYVQTPTPSPTATETPTATATAIPTETPAETSTVTKTP